MKGICVSCIIESETANRQRKTARYINAAGRADKLDCATPRDILRRFITCCISQNILSEKGKENKISLLKMPGVHAIINNGYIWKK